MHDFITTLPTTSAPSKMHHHHPQSKHKESMSTLAGACWATAPLKFIILNSNFFTPLAAVFFTLWIVSLRHYTSSATALPFRWRRLLLYRWFSYIAGLTALQPAKSVTAWSFNKMSPTAIQFLRQKNDWPVFLTLLRNKNPKNLLLRSEHEEPSSWSEDNMFDSRLVITSY